MHIYSSRRFAKILSSLSLTLPLLAGCGESTVHPSVALVDRTTNALSLGSFMEVNGVYGPGCTNRTGSWSASLGGVGLLTNPALTVIQHDAGCALSASSVRFGSAVNNHLYSPAVSLALNAAFASSGSPFVATIGDPAAFYGNLRIQPDLTFGSDFAIDMVYSEDPKLVTASMIATFAVQSATATAGVVNAPDYTIDMTGFVMQVDVNRIVQYTGGSGALTDMNTTGQSYVVSTADLGAAPSYGSVDAAFQGGTQFSLSGMNPTIAAANFNLDGTNLSAGATRTLIIANMVSGTTSYEVFHVGFSVP